MSRRGGIALAAFGVAFAVGMLSCKPAVSTSAGATSRDLQAKITAESGVTLEYACVPTGAEKCFDAIDDNCNGLIDEGCGLPTGPIQFVIAWGDNPVDVDLTMLDPSGNRINETARNRAGFKLDRDCPRDGCQDANYEVIHFEGADPPHGTYIVEVKLGEVGRGKLPAKVHLGARVGTRSYGAQFQLTVEEPSKKLEFTL